MKKLALVTAVLMVVGCASQSGPPSDAGAEPTPRTEDVQPVSPEPTPQVSPATEPHCDFALPDQAPEGAQPIEPDEFTPAVVAAAVASANRPDWGQPHITITNAWQVTDELKAAAGYSEAGAGALVLLASGGESQLFMLGVRGAPGPASIHSIQGDFVIVSQGYGYVAVNYRTGEVFRCERTRVSHSDKTFISKDDAIKTALAGIVGDLTVPRAVLNEEWRSPDNQGEAMPVWEITIAYKAVNGAFRDCVRACN